MSFSIEEIKGDVIRIAKEIVEIPEESGDLETILRNGLKEITEKYTTWAYTFNLAMEYFVSNVPTKCYDALRDILDKDVRSADAYGEDDLSVAFGAYYALSLIYKKQNALKELKELTGDAYEKLDIQPLYYEVKARYYKRIGEHKDALRMDETAMDILESRGVNNPAVGISYASTVCSILENFRGELHQGIIAQASKNIEDAIAINPQYPKYYYLKAKLLFYAIPRDASRETMENLAEQAIASARKARVILHEMRGGKGQYRAKEEKEYSDLIETVRNAVERWKKPRFPRSNADLDGLKAQILQTESAPVCKSMGILPPVPALMKGDKYFFICYSSKDFHSVYSDLLELYKRKVPFRYDEQLESSSNWWEQIERYVSDPDCVGVVFYLSKNVLSTDSVCQEIDIVKKHNKKYFTVNLEGSLAPSRILIRIILETCSLNPPHYSLKGNTMIKYLTFFQDGLPFAHKFREHTDGGTAHFASYMENIQKSFPTLDIGEHV